MRLIRLKFAVATLTACVLSCQTADIAQRLSGREIQSHRGGRGLHRTVHGPEPVGGGQRRGRCLVSVEFLLRVAAAPATPSTPGAVEAPLVDAGAGTAESFAKLGARARGAIALVSNPEMKSFDALFAEYMRKYDLGSETIFFVLEAQTELAGAKLGLLQAEINYQLAVADVDHATGELLEPYHVQIAELTH